MKLLLLISLGIFLSSCRYASDLSSFETLELKKEELVKLQEESLSYQNQQVLRDYFSVATRLMTLIKEDARYSNYFHRKFFAYFKDDYCEKALISKNLYDIYSQKCSINGFYICSESFRDFKFTLEEFYKNLTQEERSKLQSNKLCNDLAKDWELNEN